MRLASAPLTRSWIIAAALAVVFSAAALRTQAVTITINEPRPLAAVLTQLEDRFGWAVTYEDPLYAHPSEMTDVTATVRRDGDLSKKVFVPRYGQFTFSYPASSGANPSRSEQDALLTALLDQYHRSGNDGVFGLARSGDVVHVVPTMAKDASGSLRPYRSILDRNISIPEGSRSALDMLAAIQSAVNAGGDPTVGLASAPTNLLVQTRVQGGATNESARSVLVRTLSATNRKLTWRLLCQPARSACLLNVHLVDHR